jgi:hypothetical protein
MTSNSITHMDLHKTKQEVWLMRNWSTFDAQTSHRQSRTHKTYHSPDLGKATTFPFIVFFMLGHGANTQMSFCFGTPKLES